MSRSSLLALCLLACGCGYSLGYRAPPGVQTVAVPIFQNITFPLRRDIEYDLTARLRREIEARSDLDIVDSSAADLVVLGTVREFQDPTVAEGPRDEEIESVLVIVVDLVVEDHVNSRRSEVSVQVVEPISNQLGETTYSVRDRAVRNLTERMLLAIEPWDSEETDSEEPGAAEAGGRAEPASAPPPAPGRTAW